MEERKILIEINGEPREVMAGNAALLRFRRLGGKMDRLTGLDTGSTDGILDAMDEILLLIQTNLVCAEGQTRPTIEELANGFGNMEVISKALGDFFAGVPWLKNQQATGSADK